MIPKTNNYSAPQACWEEQVPRQLLCQSNLEDMEYREGEWDSDLTY
ncbi:MAG: hypothetical protein J6Y45_05600 [Bacteroidales bacterium]|nr:hypothetical protein [Bacteroidales bacterium]MBP5521466.1 hypothetical protein [Bacteroidales bacterium]